MSTSIDLFLYGLLFVLFMAFFGIPSIEQYRKKETIFITSEKMTNGIDAPAISLFAVDNNIGYGFKTETNQTNSLMARSTGNFLWYHCQEIKQNDLNDCISSDSYELTDFLITAIIDIPIKANFGKVNKTLWHEDIGLASNGKVFTWNPQRTITRDWNELIFLSLKRNFKFFIFVHDINFYSMSTSPRGSTQAFWEFNGNTTKNHYREIALVKHKRLNLDHQPCEETEDYIFLDCVKEGLAQQVGCRLPWDKKTNQEREVCTKGSNSKSLKFCPCPSCLKKLNKLNWWQGAWHLAHTKSTSSCSASQKIWFWQMFQMTRLLLAYGQHRELPSSERRFPENSLTLPSILTSDISGAPLPVQILVGWVWRLPWTFPRILLRHVVWWS